MIQLKKKRIKVLKKRLTIKFKSGVVRLGLRQPAEKMCESKE